MARSGGPDVGRIAAILDRAPQRFPRRSRPRSSGSSSRADDPAVAGRLFEAARPVGAGAKDDRSCGARRIRRLNDEAGLLVDGFDSPPVIMMTYNPRYYPALLEGRRLPEGQGPPRLLVRRSEPEPLARLAASRDAGPPARDGASSSERSRSAGCRRDLPRIREVYNDAWEKNWGFVPMTAEEMDFMARRLKPLLDQNFLFLAEPTAARTAHSSPSPSCWRCPTTTSRSRR